MASAWSNVMPVRGQRGPGGGDLGGLVGDRSVQPGADRAGEAPRQADVLEIARPAATERGVVARMDDDPQLDEPVLDRVLERVGRVERPNVEPQAAL